MRPTVIRGLAFVAQSALGIFLLWWLLSQSNVDVGQLVRRLSETSVVPLILGVGCFAASMGIGALRFYLFLPASVSFSYLIGTTLLQHALLTFMPWRLGEMSYPLLLRRDYNIPVVSSGAVILAIRLVDLFVILVVAILGGTKLGIDMRWITVLAVVGLMLCATATLVMWRKGVPRIFQRVTLALSPLREPRRLAAFIVFSICIFMLTSLQSAFIFRSVGFSIGLPDIALLNALTLLAGLLPIHPPGGWGTIDSFQVVILEHLHHNRDTSSIAILVAHSLFTLLIFIGGIVGWVLRGKHRPAFKVGLVGSLTRID